jgi:hypothetical protein
MLFFKPKSCTRCADKEEDAEAYMLRIEQLEQELKELKGECSHNPFSNLSLQQAMAKQKITRPAGNGLGGIRIVRNHIE